MRGDDTIFSVMGLNHANVLSAKTLIILSYFALGTYISTVSGSCGVSDGFTPSSNIIAGGGQNGKAYRISEMEDTYSNHTQICNGFGPGEIGI